jgi:hypothetical protein
LDYAKAYAASSLTHEFMLCVDLSFVGDVHYVLSLKGKLALEILDERREKELNDPAKRMERSAERIIQRFDRMDMMLQTLPERIAHVLTK